MTRRAASGKPESLIIMKLCIDQTIPTFAGVIIPDKTVDHPNGQSAALVVRTQINSNFPPIS